MDILPGKTDQHEQPVQRATCNRDEVTHPKPKCARPAPRATGHRIAVFFPMENQNRRFQVTVRSAARDTEIGRWTQEAIELKRTGETKLHCLARWHLVTLCSLPIINGHQGGNVLDIILASLMPVLRQG